MALLYADYAVAYAAKTTATVTDLSLKAPKSIFAALWEGERRSMGAFENLKTMANVRVWYNDTDVRELVLSETGLDLRSF